MKQAKGLITGGGGAIGVHLIAHLMRQTDWDLVVLDSFAQPEGRDRLSRICHENPTWKSRVKILEHDLRAPLPPSLIQSIGDVSHIVHLAAISDLAFSIANPVQVLKHNFDSMLVMLEYARQTPHESFVYVSTDEVYGPVRPGEAHSEWSAYRPANPYAASKAASECAAYAYWRAGQVKLIIANTMNNFGEMQSPKKFPAVIQKQIQSGKKVTIYGNHREIGSRFYLHSLNTADAILYILKKLPPRLYQSGSFEDPDRYHIVGDQRVDNLELAKTVARILETSLEYELVDFERENPTHGIHYGLKDNKLYKLGWKPPRNFEQSLQETVEWQSKNPEWLD